MTETPETPPTVEDVAAELGVSESELTQSRDAQRARKKANREVAKRQRAGTKRLKDLADGKKPAVSDINRMRAIQKLAGSPRGIAERFAAIGTIIAGGDEADELVRRLMPPVIPTHLREEVPEPRPAHDYETAPVDEEREANNAILREKRAAGLERLRGMVDRGELPPHVVEGLELAADQAVEPEPAEV